MSTGPNTTATAAPARPPVNTNAKIWADELPKLRRNAAITTHRDVRDGACAHRLGTGAHHTRPDKHAAQVTPHIVVPMPPALIHVSERLVVRGGGSRRAVRASSFQA
jgi:hypothetical protein